MKSILLASMLAIVATPATSRANSEDQRFVTTAAQGALMQLALAELAVQRAMSEPIRSYARQAADDYRQIKSRIDRSAAASDADVALAPSRAQQASVDALLALPDEEFDMRFVELAAAETDQLLLSFRKESESGEDARFKSLAEEFLPVLERGLAAANALHASVASTIE